jgi:hypothetical protein
MLIFFLIIILEGKKGKKGKKGKTGKKGKKGKIGNNGTKANQEIDFNSLQDILNSKYNYH